MVLKCGYYYNDLWKFNFSGEDGVIQIELSNPEEGEFRWVHIVVENGDIVEVTINSENFSLVIPTNHVKYHRSIMEAIKSER